MRKVNPSASFLVLLFLLIACTKSAVLDEGFRGDDAANGSLYFSVSPASGLVTNENGGTATFTLVMLRQPKSDVSVPILSNNTGEGQVYQQGGNCSVSGQPSASTCNIVFTTANWNVPQTVKVGGVDDAVKDQTIAYKVLLNLTASTDPNFAKIDPPDVSLSNLDNDTPGITLLPAITGQNQTTEAGGSVFYNVYLNSQPTATTTLTINTSNTAAGRIARTGGVCDTGSVLNTTACTLTFSTGACVQSAGSWCFDTQFKITGQDDAILNGASGSNTAYNISITAASADPNYNGMAASAALVNIDNESGKRIFLTAATTNSSFGSFAAADGFCGGDVNKPASGIYKAMIAKSTASTRVACTNALCSPAGGQTNWVLLANTNYYRASDGILIGTTTGNAIFSFPLSSSLVGAVSSYFTGLNADWTTGQDCTGWSGAGFCNTADGSVTTNASIFNGSVGFAVLRQLLCVEQ